jgi:hypothetical protein
MPSMPLFSGGSVNVEIRQVFRSFGEAICVNFDIKLSIFG